MYEKFTHRARKVIQLANQAAKESHHEQMDIEDLLLAVLQDEDGGAAAVLNEFGVDWQALRCAAEELIRPVADANREPCKTLPYSLRAKRAIQYAITERLDLGGNLGTEHLLLGIVCEGESNAAQVLAGFGLTRIGVRDKMRQLEAPPD